MANKKDRLQLSAVNFILLGAAALLLILGYAIMSANEIVVSPLILAIVYVAIVPLALLYKTKPKD